MTKMHKENMTDKTIGNMAAVAGERITQRNLLTSFWNSDNRKIFLLDFSRFSVYINILYYFSKVRSVNILRYLITFKVLAIGNFSATQ